MFVFVKLQYCGQPLWPRGSVSGLRRAGLGFRFLYAEDSVICFLLPSSFAFVIQISKKHYSSFSSTRKVSIFVGGAVSYVKRTVFYSVQSQKAVSAYLKSEQILHFGFAGQYCLIIILESLQVQFSLFDQWKHWPNVIFIVGAMGSLTQCYFYCWTHGDIDQLQMLYLMLDQ